MPRCSVHRITEPCFYCKNGIPAFANVEARLEFLENRVGSLEHRVRSSAEEGHITQDDLDMKQLDIKQAIGVVRDYALGDLVMLSASLRALKQKDPNRPLVLVTDPGLFDVLDGADYLDAILSKYSYEHAKFYETYNLVHAVETECGGKLSVKEYLATPRPDVFAKLLGVEGGAEKFPVPINPEALSKMRAILWGLKPPFIGLASTCHSAVRTMPPDYIEPLAKLILNSYEGTVVLLGKTDSWNKQLADIEMPGVINLIDALSIKELIAACSLMNAIISPDTGTMHIAGALGIKCLAAMGNNNPKIFAGFYPTVKVLQPAAKELSCVPCNDRSIPCLPLPPGQYGASCMRLMTPERICAAFREFYNGKKVAYLHDTPLTYIGGAEITTRKMVREGRDFGYNIRLFDNQTPIDQFYSLYGYDLIILSNIWRFSEEAMGVIMKAIRTVPYIKYEHDHDGLGEKPQGKYPRADYAKKIFGNSALNIFVSPAHKEDYLALRSRLGDSICIPELIDEAMFRPVAGVKRQPKTALIGVPGKWSRQDLEDYIEQHKELKVDVLDRVVPHEKMPELYSQYEYFVHFPQRKWPCDRVVFEAALCGCKVVTNGTVEALSWGKDLTDTEDLRAWLREVPHKFWGEVKNILEGATRG